MRSVHSIVKCPRFKHVVQLIAYQNLNSSDFNKDRCNDAMDIVLLVCVMSEKCFVDHLLQRLIFEIEHM